MEYLMLAGILSIIAIVFSLLRIGNELEEIKKVLWTKK